MQTLTIDPIPIGQFVSASTGRDRRGNQDCALDSATILEANIATALLGPVM